MLKRSNIFGIILLEKPQSRNYIELPTEDYFNEYLPQSHQPEASQTKYFACLPEEHKLTRNQLTELHKPLSHREQKGQERLEDEKTRKVHPIPTIAVFVLGQK